MIFPLVHALHEGAAAGTLALFIWRGWRMWRGRPVAVLLWRRIVPDTIDTLLLLTGVAMAVMLAIHPLKQPWLAAKLAAVAGYIGLGFVAFRGSGATARCAWLAALLLFGYIVAVAHSRQPWPW